jgi:hypothetical protein
MKLILELHQLREHIVALIVEARGSHHVLARDALRQ